MPNTDDDNHERIHDRAREHLEECWRKKAHRPKHTPPNDSNDKETDSE